MSKFSHFLSAFGVLILGLAGGARQLHAQTCNTASNVTTCTPAVGQITWVDTGTGPMSEYGTGRAALSVSGVAGTVTGITVTINNFTTHNQGVTPIAGDFGIMLVAPNGKNIVFYAEGCGNSNQEATTDFTNLTFTSQDSGANTWGVSGNKCSDYVSGTYKPFVASGAVTVGPFPSPAPSGVNAGPAGSQTFALVNSPAISQSTANFASNGSIPWKLYMFNTADLGAGPQGTPTTASIGTSGGPAWSVQISWSASSTGTNTSLQSGTNPSFTLTPSNQTTLTATVTPNTVSGGTVAFKDGASTIAGCGSQSVSLVSGSVQATCTASFSTEGVHLLTAVYSGSGSFLGSTSPSVTQVVNNHSTAQSSPPAGTVGFCNTGLITIPGPGETGTETDGAPASPYASEIFVTGQTGLINAATIYLNNYGHTSPEGMALMLVGPNGHSLDFMSLAGGGHSVSSVGLVFADSASGQVPFSGSVTLASGTYKPTAANNTTNPTAFCHAASCDNIPTSEQAPNPFVVAAPLGGTQGFPGPGTLTSEFGGSNPNGTWQLFAANLALGETGSVGGWCINFSLTSGDATSTALSSSENPSFIAANGTSEDAVTFTAVVTDTQTAGRQINEGTVTFSASTVNGVTTLGTGNVHFNGSQNVATVTTSTSTPFQLIEGANSITATYNGTTNFGASSSAHLNQIVNRHTVETINSPTYSYCNQGPITSPLPTGPSSPYPSNIFVTGLPGTTNKVTLGLDNYSSNQPNVFASLVVAPGGAQADAIDFFSAVGGASTVSGLNLTFQDGSPSVGGSLSSGPFAMTSSGFRIWLVPAPANFVFAQPQGGGLLSTFNNANNIGTWALYKQDLTENLGGETVGTWCVNLTQTLPDISLTATPMTHSPNIFTRGQAASFTITATNLGPGPTGDPTLTITDTLPIGLTFVSGTGTGWSCSVTSGTPSTGQTVTCTNPTPIAATASSAVTINVTVGTGNTTADTILTTASSAGTGGDNPTTTGNDSTSSGNIAVAGTVLTINKTHSDPFTQGQVGATYSITVTNTGATGSGSGAGATVGTVMVTDALPTSFGTHPTAVTGTGWNCGPATSGVSCTLNAPLAVGTTTNPITVTVTVLTTAEGTVANPLINQAILTATTDQIGTTDNTCANNVTCHNDPTHITQVPSQMTANTSTTPQTATVNTAFTPLAVTVLDAGNNPVSGVSVTFTAPGTGASGKFTGNVTTIPVTTNASGVASAAFTANTTAGGQYTVTATATNLPTVNFLLTNSPGAAASVTATAGSSQSATISTAFTNALSATVKDSFSNPVPGVTVTFAAPPQTGASATFAGGTNTATTNASGVATSVTVSANSHAGGPYNVTASAPGVATPASFQLTNLVGSAATVAVSSGSGQSAAISTAFTNPLVALVTDSGGNPVSGVVVTFAAPPQTGASATFAGGTNTATTNASGLATSVVVSANGHAGGPYNVTASAPGVATPATFSLTNTGGSAATVAVSSGSGQSATISTAFTSPLVALVTDSGGNPVSGVVVTFAAPPQTGASATFAGGTNTATTNASGLATSVVVSANGHAGGPYNVTASAPGVATPATFSLTNTAGSAATVAVSSGSGQSTAINTAFTNPLVALVTDSGGNPVSGVVVTFAPPPQTGASATFAGGTNTATTNSAGLATSVVVSANGHAGGPYNVTASAPGVATPATFSMTNTAGSAATVAVSSGSGQSATISTAFTSPLVALVTDSGGNPVSGVVVTFAAPPQTGASATFAGGTNTATTNSAGLATSVVVSANGHAGGPYNVTASAPGVATPANFSLTNTAGSAATVAVSSGSGQSTAISTAFTNPLVALVTDSGGNPVSGVVVTFAPPPQTVASASFAGGTNTATTNASGLATSVVVSANGHAGGPYSVTASAPGATTSATFTLTNTAGSAATVAISSGSGQSAAISTAFSNPLVALVTDSGGNPVSGVVVTFAAPPQTVASATFAGGTNTATTNASGLATSVVVSANGHAGGPYSVTASAPGATTSANFSLTNTDTPATVTNVTSTNANASYGVGASIAITISFNKAVNVTGTPQLSLNSGGTAGYSGGTGTSTLTFTYNVLSGQNSAHLDYTGTGALTLNSGTINGSSGTAANLALPAPGTAGSLGFNKSIVIDTTAPTVVSYSVLFGNQSYNVIGSSRTRLPWQITGISVVFSKPITSGDMNSLTGVAVTGFSGLGTTTLNWGFSAVVDANLATVLQGTGADALKDAAGNALGGGNGFSQALKVLWGDFNDDGFVSSTDTVQVNAARSQPYNIFADMNGDLVIDINDVNIVRSRLGTTLP